MLVASTGLKIYGAGQWLEDKHGARSRRSWCKLHLAVDADSGEIIAHGLADQDTDDLSQVQPLLNQIDGKIGQFTSDGAYDGKPTYGKSCSTVASQGLSFRLVQRRWKAVTPDRLVKWTATSRRSRKTGG